MPPTFVSSRLALAAFVINEITWPDGGVEVIRIVELRESGWVVSETSRGRGWFNLAQARSIRTPTMR